MPGNLSYCGGYFYEFRICTKRVQISSEIGFYDGKYQTRCSPEKYFWKSGHPVKNIIIPVVYIYIYIYIYIFIYLFILFNPYKPGVPLFWT